MKNKNEVIMVNDGKETEVHVDSVADMEACGWKVKKGEKVPEKTEPVAPVANVSTRTPEQQAERDGHDAGAKKATADQLREALEQLGIKYEKDAKKADLLALYLGRP